MRPSSSWETLGNDASRAVNPMGCRNKTPRRMVLTHCQAKRRLVDRTTAWQEQSLPKALVRASPDRTSPGSPVRPAETARGQSDPRPTHRGKRYANAPIMLMDPTPRTEKAGHQAPRGPAPASSGTHGVTNQPKLPTWSYSSVNVDCPGTAANSLANQLIDRFTQT